MAITDQFYFTDNQKITIIPTLKFFKHGPKSSDTFDNRHLAKHGYSLNNAMKSLFDFIDQQFGRISFKVLTSLNQVFYASFKLFYQASVFCPSLISYYFNRIPTNY